MGIHFWKEQMTKIATKVARRHRRRRNNIAKMLRDPIFRQRVVSDKKKLLKSDRKSERLELNEAIKELD